MDAAARPAFAARRGYTPLPHPVFDVLLCLDLSQRELRILLLVIRLTYGCRNARWVALRPQDLSAVGIGSNHARPCLQRLLSRGLLAQNGERHEYRLQDDCVLAEPEAREAACRRKRQLNGLLARQLGEASPKREVAIPKKGEVPFPKWEHSPSRNGNSDASAQWHFDRSTSQFVKQEEAA